MSRFTVRLMLRLWLLHLLVMAGSRVIGRTLLTEPTAVFSELSTVTWVDIQTGVIYRREYPGVYFAHDLRIMSASCQMPALHLIGGATVRLGFVDFRTGRLRDYVSPVVFAELDWQPSPDGRYWWYQFLDNGQLQHVILNMASGASVARIIRTGSDSFAVWSPDSRYLVEVTGENSTATGGQALENIRAALVNPEIGESLPLPDSPTGRYFWSPDSRSIALVDTSGGITLVDTGGQIDARLTQVNDVLQLYWLPDSRHVLLLARAALSAEDFITPYRMVVWSLDDNSLSYSSVRLETGIVASLSPDGSRLFYDALNQPPVIVDTHSGDVILTLPVNRLILRRMNWSADSRYLIQVWQDDARQLRYAGGLQIADMRTLHIAWLPLIPEYRGWQSAYVPDGIAAYFDFDTDRSLLVRSGESGVRVTEMEQPNADYGVWCSPEFST